MLLACGDDVPEDDPTEDLVPPLAVGEPVGFDEVIIGPQVGNQELSAVAVRGSRFMVAFRDIPTSSIELLDVGSDGTALATIVTAAVGTFIVGLACLPDGTCLLAYRDLELDLQLIRVAPDNTLIDAQPLRVDIGAPLEGLQVGADATAFVVVYTDQQSNIDAFRIGPSGPPGAAFAVTGYLTNDFMTFGFLGCHAAGCFLGNNRSFVHLGSDQSVTPIAVPSGFSEIGPIACGTSSCLLVDRSTDGVDPIEVARVSLSGTVEGSISITGGSGFQSTTDGSDFLVVTGSGVPPQAMRIPQTGAVVASATFDIVDGTPACTDGHCMLFATGNTVDQEGENGPAVQNDVVGTRLDGTTLIDPSPQILTLSANGQGERVLAAFDGAGYLVRWKEERLGTLREHVAIREGDTWPVETSTRLPIRAGFVDSVGWTGTRFLAVGKSPTFPNPPAAVTISSDAELLDDMPFAWPGGGLTCNASGCVAFAATQSGLELVQLDAEGRPIGDLVRFAGVSGVPIAVDDHFVLIEITAQPISTLRAQRIDLDGTTDSAEVSTLEPPASVTSSGTVTCNAVGLTVLYVDQDLHARAVVLDQTTLVPVAPPLDLGPVRASGGLGCSSLGDDALAGWVGDDGVTYVARIDAGGNLRGDITPVLVPVTGGFRGATRFVVTEGLGEVLLVATGFDERPEFFAPRLRVVTIR